MFQVGDLIKWYEVYGDLYITKATGLGIVTEITEVCFGKQEQIAYRVYRSEKQDIIMLDEHCIEKF